MPEGSSSDAPVIIPGPKDLMVSLNEEAEKSPDEDFEEHLLEDAKVYFFVSSFSS